MAKIRIDVNVATKQTLSRTWTLCTIFQQLEWTLYEIMA